MPAPKKTFILALMAGVLSVPLLAQVYTPGFAPMLEGYAAPLDMSALPVVPSSTNTVVGVTESLQFNSHNYIHHDGKKFFAMWSTNSDPNEDRSGQRVRFATSTDGQSWSIGGYVTPVPTSGFRWIARGFWQRGEDLLALASYDESTQGYFGDSLVLKSFRWDGAAWVDEATVAENTINNFPPEQLPTGEWLFTRRDSDAVISFARGDIGSWEYFPVVQPAGTAFNEPTFTMMPGDAVLSAVFRDNSDSVVYRSFSYDLGETWTVPHRTNFPDASSKHFTLKLSDGRYVMASNAGVGPNRTPLNLSISDDGYIFDKVVILRQGVPSTTYPGAGKERVGYQYPHMIEHGGYLYVIYSQNKEPILVSRVAISDLP